MRTHQVLPIVILTLKLSSVIGIHECCLGENLLYPSGHGCSPDPQNISKINIECTERILVDDVEKFDYHLYDDGTMKSGSGEEIKYCHSKNGDKNDTGSLYVVCLPDREFENTKITVVAILMLISTIFAIFTIIVYASIPKMLDLQGICIVHTLVGLSLGSVSLAIVQLSNGTLGDGSCETFSHLIYLGYIYLFYWLAVLSFHIWRTTVKPNLFNGNIKWIIAYHVVAIAGTIICWSIVLLAHYSPSEMWDEIRPGLGETSCWFKSPREIWIFFYGPIVVLLIWNVIFYLWTLTALFGQVESRQNKLLKYRFKMCVRLCVIMGITWIIEILTFTVKDDRMSIEGKILMFLLDLFNILQGVLIFLVLVVFRKSVRRALATKNICNIRFPSSWQYLKDEEMESTEEKATGTTVEYCKRDNENVENDDK